MAIFLVVIEAIVLHTTCDSDALQALNIRYNHTRRQIRVFAEILEVATTERRTIDIDAWSQYHTLPAIQSFLTQSVSISSGDFGIPSGCKASESRECDARVVALPGLFPFVPKHIRSNAVRSVVCPKVRNAETLHTGTRELALSVDDINLLGKRHTFESVFHTSLDVLRRVEINGSLCLDS
jgi:hypothetical protein